MHTSLSVVRITQQLAPVQTSGPGSPTTSFAALRRPEPGSLRGWALGIALADETISTRPPSSHPRDPFKSFPGPATPTPILTPLRRAAVRAQPWTVQVQPQLLCPTTCSIRRRDSMSAFARLLDIRGTKPLFPSIPPMTSGAFAMCFRSCDCTHHVALGTFLVLDSCRRILLHLAQPSMLPVQVPY